jgi:hypothetical protein
VRVSRIAAVLSLFAAGLCLLVGAILAVMAFVVLVTKITSLPDVRAILFIAGLGLAAFGCFRAANRLRRVSLARLKA